MIIDYLKSAKKQFESYKLLGDKTFAQLTGDQLFWKYNKESNSIATIISHLSGNMLSRWTHFLTTDGEKEWRDRDLEFDNDIKDSEELIKKWNDGWACLFAAIDSISEENFDIIIYIRNVGHTITEAINRQLTHYPYHIGQIVFIGKMIKDNEWASLSIPRGKSKEYNDDQFSRPKRKGHFTDGDPKR